MRKESLIPLISYDFYTKSAPLECTSLDQNNMSPLLFGNGIQKSYKIEIDKSKDKDKSALHL